MNWDCHFDGQKPNPWIFHISRRGYEIPAMERDLALWMIKFPNIVVYCKQHLTYFNHNFTHNHNAFAPLKPIYLTLSLSLSQLNNFPGIHYILRLNKSQFMKPQKILNSNYCYFYIKHFILPNPVNTVLLHKLHKNTRTFTSHQIA